MADPDPYTHSESWLVRTFELDSNGHVNNAVYLNYAELVAVEHAEILGLGRAWTDANGGLWAVHEHHITYHLPAVYRDRLRLTTRVEAMDRARCTRRTLIERESDGALLAEVVTEWVWLRIADQRPSRIPAELLTAWKERRPLSGAPS
jgi:acyl-CoA thioester hydrolase